jgi:hypothetical protein
MNVGEPKKGMVEKKRRPGKDKIGRKKWKERMFNCKETLTVFFFN